METTSNSLKTYRIFIASSSELAADRKEFREFLSVENDRMTKKGVYLELVQWEYFFDAVANDRKQDDYNRALKDCDIIICLFNTKAGKYTLEEFNVAYQQFKTSGKPLIYVYCKTGGSPPDHSNPQELALVNFKKSLGEIGHFYTRYDSAGDLKYQFRKQLDRLEDNDIITLKDEINFLGGKKSFNEYLTKSLIESISPFSRPAAVILNRIGTIPNWESQEVYSRKAKEIIAYSYVGVIGLQLGDLIAIGNDNQINDSIKQLKYVQQTINIVKQTLDLINFSFLSKLWDIQKNQYFQIPKEQHLIIQNRFDLVFEQDINQQFQLLQTLSELFQHNNLASPFDDFNLNLLKDSNEKSSLHKICQDFNEVKLCLDQNKINLRNCFEVEILLADFLRHFAFLVKYKMASIKDIGFNQVRNSTPHYLHRYVSLGLDSKANVNTEKAVYTPDTVHTDAVLLYKGDSYKGSLNLFPFIIDYNALILENGSKICFFKNNDISDDSKDFLFLMDNSIVNIEVKDIDQSVDQSKWMLDFERRKKLNFNNVINGLKEAKNTILNAPRPTESK